MSRKGDKGGLSLVGLRRNALLGLLVCALLRGALLLWIGIGDPGTCVLFALAGGALVPRLIGSFEPFVQVMSVAPDLLALFQLSDYVPSALGRESSFALPRVGGRRLWAGEKCLQLAACVAIYETASASAVLAMMVFLSGAAPAVLAALLLPVLQCILLDFALLLALLLCANLLALERDDCRLCDGRWRACCRAPCPGGRAGRRGQVARMLVAVRPWRSGLAPEPLRAVWQRL